jgi:uncharacterized protein (TIGR02145 family)
MKNFFLLLFICTCAHSSAQFIPVDSTPKDREGNTYRIKKMPDNKLWMTDNLKINIPGSYCYDDVKQNCERYGRLYTWESAKEGCRMLGDEWRLPTDDEWRQLAKQYGGMSGDSQDSGKTAFKTLLVGGASGLDALLGGGRSTDGKYRRGDAHGFYWTATEVNSTTATFYNFGKGSAKLYHQDAGEKTEAFAVRCVREVDVRSMK